jgi:hypothetical protein
METNHFINALYDLEHEAEKYIHDTLGDHGVIKIDLTDMIEAHINDESYDPYDEFCIEVPDENDYDSLKNMVVTEITKDSVSGFTFDSNCCMLPFFDEDDDPEDYIETICINDLPTRSIIAIADYVVAEQNNI